MMSDRAPSETEQEQVQAVKELGERFLRELGEIERHQGFYTAREVNHARTRVEEAVMWATKAATAPR